MESVLPICRICLNTCTTCIDLQKPFMSKEEYNDESTTLNYLECLRFCTGLPMDEDDNGPQNVCEACDTEMQIVYNFIQKAKKSQMILEENWLKDHEKVIEHMEILIENNDEEKIFDLQVLEDLESYDNCSNNKELNEGNVNEVEEKSKIEFNDEETQDAVFPEDSKISQKNIEKAKRNKCRICDRTYTTKHLLKTHLKYHERKEVEHKSDACKICGKKFSTQRYLRKHMVTHQDTRETLKCQYCDKEYVTKTSLNSHERIHQGQTLKCNECEKEFTRNYELKIHMRFHKREFPFECTLCERKFAIKGHLQTHMRQHQGIKVECDECGKLFGSTKALSEHSYTHTKMPFPCDFCHKGYPSRQKYKMHLEKVHTNQIKNIDVTQLQSLNNVKNLKKRKKYTYVQVLEEEETDICK